MIASKRIERFLGNRQGFHAGDTQRLPDNIQRLFQNTVWSLGCGFRAGALILSTLTRIQGYLTYKKKHPPQTLP